MKKIRPLILLILIFAVVVNLAFAESYKIRKSFIDELKQGVEDKNYKNINSLYCENSNARSQSWGIFQQNPININIATKHHPLHDVEDHSNKFESTLHLCFETKETKQKCQILNISVSSSKICINE